MDICIILTSNQVNYGQLNGIQIPNVTQIKNPDECENEFARIETMLNDLNFQANKYYEPFALV